MDKENVSNRVIRFEDMSPDGQLILDRQQDGDVIVTIYTKEKGFCSVEFCNSGGQSYKTLSALIKLMEVMKSEEPQFRY